jgi:hypothetical protein
LKIDWSMHNTYLRHTYPLKGGGPRAPVQVPPYHRYRLLPDLTQGHMNGPLFIYSLLPQMSR